VDGGCLEANKQQVCGGCKQPVKGRGDVVETRYYWLAGWLAGWLAAGGGIMHDDGETFYRIFRGLIKHISFFSRNARCNNIK
jgi:hypothetical protein